MLLLLQLHYKYNPNLVGEEDQELEEHLNRRHLNARRFTHLASSTRRPTITVPPRRRTGELRGRLRGGGSLHMQKAIQGFWAIR